MIGDDEVLDLNDVPPQRTYTVQDIYDDLRDREMELRMAGYDTSPKSLIKGTIFVIVGFLVILGIAILLHNYDILQ